jgi:hypothetical protein
MTQKPQAGGLFEFCPGIRSAQKQNFAAVGAVLQGDHTSVQTLNLEPGDLQIFYGRHSLHRVTRVRGDTQRHTVILAYTEQAGAIADAERTRRLFGRVSEAHLNNGNAVRALPTGSGSRVA